ncbi:MAG: hypothetical protein LUH59_03975 [Firmicutes bacterium]|nr:hypothetical protein [Bacillota bacterium]
MAGLYNDGGLKFSKKMIFQILVLLISLAVYAGYGLSGLCYLVAATLIAWALGLLLRRSKWLLVPGIILASLPLLLIRLEPLTGMSVLAPLGVSYFTLQIISYLVDVYKEKYEPERNLVSFGVYVTYLPHLFFGPIESFDDMKSALSKRRITWDGLSSGTIRAMWGLFKKYAIAARAGVVIATIAADTETYSGAYALFAMLLYSVELYADFSGGMDIVLGISEMLGLKLSENFGRPYFSETVQEFWRRWHMTLGEWLRKYVYIPLGGNRKGKVRKVLNLVVTFLVSGLWHGINYLLWGVIHGLLVATGKGLKTRFKTLNRAVTFLLVSVLWSFFIWSDTLTALKSIASVFTSFSITSFLQNFGSLGLDTGEWIVFLAALLILFAYDALKDRFDSLFVSSAPAARVLVCGMLAVSVLLFGMYGIGFEAEEFIYSRF